MICKKDVILWFKELESYKRIDTMCTLLNMCLPFELRFLGTCLEELGRRDSQELRGMELRVNNPQDLAADMVACQKGEPTDKKIRRKMALYLALIRACNRTCVTEIFRTLDGWGERDFLSMTDSDTLQELLLVYTMAANHPVFSFEQHLKCTEIFEKIKNNKLVCDQPHPQTQIPQVQMDSGPGMGTGPQQEVRHLIPSHQDILQQHSLHAMHLSGQHPHSQMSSAPIQVLQQGSIPLNFPQAHIAKLIPADGNLQHQITVDGIPHMLSSNISIPTDSGTILGPPSAFYSLRPYPPQGPTMEHPPQSSSPMLSQQSSPSSSRTTSPNRTSSSSSGMFQQQQVRNTSQRMGPTSLKNVRRPSAETTPPPMTQQQHQQMLSNELILPQTMKHMDDVVINSDGTGNQLQTLIRNGFTRSGHHSRLKAGTYMTHHQQQQQQSSQSPVSQHFQTIPGGGFTVNPGLTYSMQNMTLSDGSMGVVGLTSGVMHSLDGSVVSMSLNSNSTKSAGSDSGSSIGSCGDISPPETPTLMTNSTSGMRLSNSDQQHQKHMQQPVNYNKQLNLTRLNGRSEKMLVGSNVVGQLAGGSNINNSNTSSNMLYAQPTTSLVNTHQQQQQPMYATDIILAPGGNAGANNLMQTSSMSNSSNNNNTSGNGGNGSCPTSNNNHTTGVLISSPSSSGGTLLGNVITSNALLLQSHHPQQQYNTNYPYHAAAVAAAAQHLASTSRPPPLLPHTSPGGMAPPLPHGTFRLPGGFQLPPNGEIIYPAYHPAGGITFLSGAAPPPPVSAPPPPGVSMRSTNAAGSGTTVSSAPLQTHPAASQLSQPTTTTTLLAGASPYSTLTVGVPSNKPMSCYNCGSQTHSGRDCQEASMDDVTRSATYKLDYSVGASSNTSPTASLGGVVGDMSSTTSTHHLQKHNIEGTTTTPLVLATASTSTSGATVSVTK